MFLKESGIIEKILKSDESQFSLNGTITRDNSCYWAFLTDMKNSRRSSKEGLLVWYGMTLGGLIRPDIFDNCVTCESYLEMLEAYLWP